MSIRIAGQVVASAGSLTAHNEDPNAHPDIRELISQGGGGGSAGSADVAEALRNQNEAEGAIEHLYNWVGTLAEYEAQNIATEHPEWIVLITDDFEHEEEEKDYYTKEEVDGKISEVGAIVNEQSLEIEKTKEDVASNAQGIGNVSEEVSALSDRVLVLENNTSGGGESESAKVAEGIENKNDNDGAIEPIYHWIGTKAEYEEQKIADEHPDWLACIIDDEASSEEDSAGASFPLFYHTFADHLFNNASWLLSDTFSWQSGDMYVSAYNHLVEDLEGITAETETIGSTEITFYPAEDGHKIVLAEQEDNVSAIYAETGVAWYYILDTENKRFKLPRDGNRFRLEANKELLDWDKQETISNGFVAPSSGFVVVGVQANDNNYYAYVTPKGGTQVSVYGGYNNDAGGQWSFIVNEGDTFSASAFNNGIFVPFLPSVKGVEEDNKKYLYFYVGNTILNQTEVDMGAVTEQLNSKVDVDLGNVTEEGKENAISWGRNFVNVGEIIASGTAAIAGNYDLGFTDNKVKIGVFECRLQTSGNGASEMSLYTDVVTNEAKVCATNNGFTTAGVITVPFISSVSINFPLTNAGVVTGTSLKFIGYFE